MSRKAWLFLVIVVGTLCSVALFSYFCWFKHNEHVAIWLEGIALILIFGLDYFNRLDEAEEQRRQHKETLEQLTLLRQQAQAATDTAIAAKKSADLTAALHRPYMGIVNAVAVVAGRYWDTAFVIRNFGTLPAFDVGFAAEYFVEKVSRWRHVEAAAVQVFPSDSFRVPSRFDAGTDDAGPLRGGERKLTVSITIPYRIQDGRSFQYTAQLSYAGEQFRIDESSTIELRPM